MSTDTKSAKQEILHMCDMCELLNRYRENANELSKDEQKIAREFEQELEKTVREHILTFYRKPKKPGVCDECSGRIVKYAQGLFKGQYFYSEPICERCNTVYRGEISPTILGVGDFEKKMRIHFNI